MNGDAQGPQTARERLCGAWRYVGTRINGRNWDRGAHPKGLIYYGPHGEFAGDRLILCPLNSTMEVTW